MGEELSAIVGSQATEISELFEVVVTPDKGNRELVHKQERDGFFSR
jgi:hypothetical protein